MKHKKNTELKAESSEGQFEHEVRLPSIEIDKDAIRFRFADHSGTNLFWIDLFRSHQDFQRELAENIFKTAEVWVITNSEIDKQHLNEALESIPNSYKITVYSLDDVHREIQSLK